MKTKIQFDPEATTATDKNTCLLFFAMAGNKGTIRRKLLSMVAEIDNDYGKPMQGIITQFSSCSHVITPIWEGKEY